MKRIMIIGCPGSGKSTLAELLAKELEVELIHLDHLNWLNDHETLSRDAFDEKLLSVLKKEEWLIDGNYNRTLTNRIVYADTIIWLDLPRVLCLYRIFKRYLKGIRDKNRKHGNPNHIDKGFIKFVWQFNENNRPSMESTLDMFPSKRVIRLKSTKQINEFRNNIALMRTDSF